MGTISPPPSPTNHQASILLHGVDAAQPPKPTHPHLTPNHYHTHTHMHTHAHPPSPDVRAQRSERLHQHSRLLGQVDAPRHTRARQRPLRAPVLTAGHQPRHLALRQLDRAAPKGSRPRRRHLELRCGAGWRRGAGRIRIAFRMGGQAGRWWVCEVCFGVGWVLGVGWAWELALRGEAPLPGHTPQPEITGLLACDRLGTSS